MTNFQGAFAAGDAAVGLAQLRPGFAKTPDDDRLFALGYPRLVLLVEDDTPPANDVAALTACVEQFHAKRIVPRAYAARRVRSLVHGPNLAAALTTWNDGAAALGDDELPVLVEDALYWAGGLWHLHVIEALVGTDRVLPLLTDAIERAVDEWTDGPIETNSGNLFALAGLLLRGSAAVVADARTRLGAVVAQRLQNEGADRWRPTAALDVVLNGRAGIERDSAPPQLAELVFANDPAWVAQLALPLLDKLTPADREIPDARLAFAGGSDVTRAWCASEARWQEQFRADFNEQRSKIA